MPIVWDRVDAELARRGLTWADLGRRIEATDQRMNNWRRRGVPAKEHKAIATALGMTVDQLLAEHWMPEHPPVGGAHLGGIPPSLVRQMSHPKSMIEPITIPWESILSEPLPALFRAVIPDDAMGPEYPRGCIVNFSTTEGPPRARDLVLVRDADGGVYFREYQVGRAGRWQAVALISGYQPLDSEADGLRVLAISMGRWGRRG